MILIIVLTALALSGLGLVYLIRNRSRNIELDVDFVVGSIDGVCKNFKVGSNVNVAGVLGTDFLDKYNYIIDFRKNRIWHRLHSISFKEAMELLRIPFIVLWQDGRKYIFIIDTGSSNSHVSKEALDTMDFDLDTSKSYITVGVGGGNATFGTATTKLYYR